MGAVKSHLLKPVKKFMIEDRAARVISRPKPVPAPSRPSTAKQLEVAKEVNPNFMENHYKKDAEFNERLKQVFVTSNVHISGEDRSEASFPHNRNDKREFDYGFWEPDKAPRGKCFLRDALKFMGDNTTDPETHTADKIASEYKLEIKDVENVLEYYRVFQIVIPTKDKTSRNLGILGASNLKRGINKMLDIK